KQAVRPILRHKKVRQGGWRIVSVTAVQLPNLSPLTIETACPREVGGPFPQNHNTQIHTQNCLPSWRQGAVSHIHFAPL
ncbi:MAG: hypothetical protein GY805_00220, partial [Chloroflexi bacterium]|nr:hypothetical protein [Chloroflexota bacterium]